MGSLYAAAPFCLYLNIISRSKVSFCLANYFSISRTSGKIPLSPYPFKGGIRMKNIVITGGSSGIGLEIAKLIAPKAETIVLVARNPQKLAAACQQLHAINPQLNTCSISADLGKTEAIEQLIQDLNNLALEYDTLINNVGYGLNGLADSLSPKEVEKCVTTNALAPVIITQNLLPTIVKMKGNILFIGAGAATHPMPGLVHYSASKNLIHGLVRGLRVDLKGTGVHITEIQPGPVATQFGAQSEATATSFSTRNPLKKVEISAQECAKQSLKALKANKALLYPGWKYRFIIRLTKCIPSPIMEHILQRFVTR